MNVFVVSRVVYLVVIKCFRRHQKLWYVWAESPGCVTLSNLAQTSDFHTQIFYNKGFVYVMLMYVAKQF